MTKEGPIAESLTIEYCVFHKITNGQRKSCYPKNGVNSPLC